MIPSIAYLDIRNDLVTGDLVLFSGDSPVSVAIKFTTFSKWSHVGLVYCIPEHNLVMLWESTTLSKIKDMTTGTLMKGVQLVPLSERIRTYRGDVGIRRLIKPLNSSQVELLAELRHEFKGRPYEESRIELAMSAFPGQGVEDLSSLFCSELVAEAMEHIDLIPDTRASNKYVPGDFAGGREPDVDKMYRDLVEIEPNIGSSLDITEL